MALKMEYCQNRNCHFQSYVCRACWLSIFARYTRCICYEKISNVKFVHSNKSERKENQPRLPQKSMTTTVGIKEKAKVEKRQCQKLHIITE